MYIGFPSIGRESVHKLAKGFCLRAVEIAQEKIEGESAQIILL